MNNSQQAQVDTNDIILKEAWHELQGVMCVTINRPEAHNALNEHVITELTKTFLDLERDPATRIIVLSSNGTVFSAGADLKWMKQVSSFSQAESIADAKKLGNLLSVINRCSKPTIASIQGPAYGGGVGLIAACDIAVCVPSAIFCLSEIKLGLIPAMISPFLVNAIGQRQVRRYALTADRMSSEEALRLGLVHQVVGDGELNATIEAFAASILKGGPRAIAASKELIHYVESRPIDEVILDETARRLADVRSSSEGKEGINAFLMKRPPLWTA